MTARRSEEDALHAAVADLLDLVLLPPAWWTTFPLGGGGKARGGKLKRRGAKKGTLDILIISAQTGWGHADWIELKSAKGRLTPEQREIMEKLISAGCQVAIARSVADVLAMLDAWGIPHKRVVIDGPLMPLKPSAEALQRPSRVRR